MINNYEILNPVTNNKEPYINKRGELVIPNIKRNYNYYIECARNTNYGRDYFILVGKDKFDRNCRKCNVDIYGRLKIRIKGEFKDYIECEIKYRGNVNYEYIESEQLYDIFKVT